MKRISALIGVIGALTASTHLHAQEAAEDFPTRDIRLVVPFAPGGTGDSVARIIAEGMQGILEVSVIVENLPGGASNTGTAEVAEAEPDGYTLLSQSDTLTTNPLVYENAGYDAQTSFAPITTITRVPVVVAVRKDLPVETLEEFVAYMQENAGTVTVGTPSVGGGNHLTGLLFKSEMGLEWTDVPYPGAGPAVTDLVGGHIDAMWSMAAPLMPHGQSGNVKILAVTTAERSELLPDVPTIAESTALSDFAIENWHGLFAPAGTPEPILAKLADAVSQALQDETTRERLTSLGLQPAGDGAEALEAEITASITRWQAVIEANDITVQ